MADELIFDRRKLFAPLDVPVQESPEVRSGRRPRQCMRLDEISVTVTTAVLFTTGTPDFPAADSGVTFTSAFDAADQFGRAASGVHFASRFRRTNGPLAGGRYRR